MNLLIKRMANGLVSGLVAGILIVGIGGRLAMRFIALLDGRQGGFSWGGTLDVLVFGLITGGISGCFYGIVEKYIFSNTLLNGVVYGILLFLALLILPISGKGAAKGFPDRQMEIYLIFGVVLVLYGILLAFTFRRYFK